MGKKRQRQVKKKRPDSDDNADADADAFWEDDHSDDEIDAFHKHRHLIPLHVEDESHDGHMDQPHPVFDFHFQPDDDTDQSDDDDAQQPHSPPRGFAAKIARQAKYLKQKFGGGEDEMDDDEDENDQQINNKSWGGRKNIYYNADTADSEIRSSDEELPKEEEAEVLRIQREKARSLSMADLGLQDDDDVESDYDKKSQGGLQDDKSKGKSKWDTLDASYEEIKKDVGALSEEEQMDVVFSSAPELIGLLSELNEAIDQLNEVKADDGKVNGEDNMGKAAVKQSEAKEALLLMYCQAICFFLLLKSEGLPVRDHPVIGRLVEIKNMLQKLKEIEERNPFPTEQTMNLSKRADTHKIGVAQVYQQQEKLLEMVSRDEVKLLEAKINQQQPVKETAIQKAKQQDQDVKIGSQSLEMLKIRANLEAKLREKGLYSSKTKLKKSLSTNPTNRNFASIDDFDDEVQNAKSSSKSKLSQIVLNKAKKVKFASGDDDLPKRDDIGERRRKHELRVLGKIGADNDNEDDGNHDDRDGNDDEEVLDDDDDDASEDEFYNQTKRKHVEKLITRQQLNSMKQIVPSEEAEQQADGKRQISYQMNKNKGLTRHRKKDLKNPRKKYRAKHSKWEKRRKGQVRDIRHASGSYGGESSGINPFVSHSVRF
ncbi:Something about silencing protein 10 [Rhynchospora pubera]|uniref:Something about silencing protein 10 n=1 Tax=Rhynchospora pubera TaxID=906938 RepID=A0AAV8HYB7_9POAL|nr:Something about silencing protein 10 [Rhynchospora pubera]